MTTGRDVLNGALKIQRLTSVIMHHMRVLADPDALARSVPVNF